MDLCICASMDLCICVSLDLCVYESVYLRVYGSMYLCISVHLSAGTALRLGGTISVSILGGGRA